MPAFGIALAAERTPKMRLRCALLFSLLLACNAGIAPLRPIEDGGDAGASLPEDGGTPPDAGWVQDGGAIALPDAGVDAGAPDAGSTGPAGIAPPALLPGEIALADGANPVQISSAPTEIVYRVEVSGEEHVNFMLTYEPTNAPVVMEVDRWDGSALVILAKTDAGVGRRTLSVFDSSGPRTFWVRVRLRTGTLEGSLAVTRTAFEDGARCFSDCARLLQLPVRNDPRVDGYDHDSGTIFRYQFGRRDLVMFLRHAGKEMGAAGFAPFIPYDLSQWDGQTPGTDVGSPRHLSHERGKDVDVSLYGTDGHAVWRSFCTTQSVSGGRECVPGTMHDLDGVVTARMIAGFFESDRVTMSFLDRELIPTVAAGAAQAAREGTIDPSLLPLYSDGRHIQHWPNHDNHIHIRVSETATVPGFAFSAESVEPP